MENFSPSLCRRWNSFMLTGFFLIILGAIALSSVLWTNLASVLLFGALLVAAGLANMLNAFWTVEWKGFFAQLIVGILSAVVGWLIVTNPAIGAASLTMLLAVFFVAAGLSRIAGSLLLNVEKWGWMLASGVATLALGLMILAQWPSSSFWVLGLFFAIDLIVNGWSNIMFSLTVRKACRLRQQPTA